MEGQEQGSGIEQRLERTMLRKTTKEFKRLAKSWDDSSSKETHIERVRRETWRFLFVPIYSREWIVATNL